MRKFKRIIALLLAAVMLMSLSACGRFELSLIKGAKKMAKLQSMHVEASMDMEYTVSMLGRDVSMEMGLGSRADIQTEPAKVLFETELSMFGLNGSIFGYAEKIGEDYEVCLSRDGEYWQGNIISSGSVPSDGEFKLGLAGAAKYLSDFERTQSGTEYNGFNADCYEGMLSAEEIREILSITGLDNAIAQEFEGFSIDMIDESCAIPMAVWLGHKDSMILAVRMDLSGIMKMALRSMLMDQELLAQDAEADIKLSGAELKIEFSQFDSLGEILRPEGC